MASRVATASIYFAQVRRLECEHCHEPFSYVWGGVQEGVESGNTAFADDDELGKVAFRKAANTLDSVAVKKEQGKGRCAHCRRLESWMVTTPFIAGAAMFLVGGGAAGSVAFFAWIVTARWLAMSVMVQVVVSLGLLGGGLLLSAVVALIAAPKMADDPGPSTEADPRSKTDEELLAWLSACEERQSDPILTWWASVSKPPVKKPMPFSMGFYDLTPTPLAVKEDLSIAARSAALNRM